MEVSGRVVVGGVSWPFCLVAAIIMFNGGRLPESVRRFFNRLSSFLISRSSPPFLSGSGPLAWVAGIFLWCRYFLARLRSLVTFSAENYAGIFPFFFFVGIFQLFCSTVSLCCVVVSSSSSLMFGSACVEGKTFEFSGGGGGVFPFRVSELSRRKRFCATLSLELSRRIRFCATLSLEELR